jgi:MFS family permease
MYHRPTSRIAILTETSLARVLQGLTPSFWGSLSDSIGRRPVYIMTLSIYVGACIENGSSYWRLSSNRHRQRMRLRYRDSRGTGQVHGFVQCAQYGRACDCKYLPLNIAALAHGNCSAIQGPVLGGILSYALSWRWIFWILAIGCGISLVAIIL